MFDAERGSGYEDTACTGRSKNHCGGGRLQGAAVTYAKQLMHGKQSDVEFDPACPLFRGCEAPLLVARYHSLAADPATLPPELKITARTADGEVMAVQHTKYPIYGVQFHPESILTPQGRLILKNFMEG